MSGSSIRFKRGNKADLPKSASSGTPLWCEDSQELYVGTNNGVAKVGVVSQQTDITNALNPVGISSDDTSTLKRNTSISMKGGTITAQTFVGDFSGNATSATKATNDSNGNNIVSTYLPKSGGTVTGTLDLTKTTDVSGTANNSPALRIGAISGEHLELDGNEIHAKASGTTVSSLNLNVDGGDVIFNGNTKKVTVSGGNVTATTFNGDLSGNATTSSSSSKVSYKGVKTMNASSTAGTLAKDAPDTGITLYGTYNDSNTPLAYGNIVNVRGAGAGQLLLGWSGSDKTTEKIYYRSHRDTADAGWGTWKQIAYTDSNISGTAAKATADASGNVITSSYYRFQTTELGASIDWNTFTTPGCYKVQNATMTSTYNAPVGEYGYGLLSVLKSNVAHENRTIQIYYSHQPKISRIWLRMLNGTGWTTWAAMLSTTGTAAKATAVNDVRDNGSLKYWTGTKAQYDAIATKDDNTIYNITDDLMSVSAVEEIEAAKQKAIKDVGSALEILYPIGSLYFTTNSVCPLTNVLGTWQVVAKNIVVDISTKATAPVKGNGITMGFTDGATNYGLQVTTNTENAWAYRTAAYGKSLPSTTGNSGNYPGTGADLGLTTDSTKSGIVADTSSLITKTNLTLNIFKRIS